MTGILSEGQSSSLHRNVQARIYLQMLTKELDLQLALQKELAHQKELALGQSKKPETDTAQAEVARRVKGELEKGALEVFSRWEAAEKALARANTSMNLAHQLMESATGSSMQHREPADMLTLKTLGTPRSPSFHG